MMNYRSLSFEPINFETGWEILKKRLTRSGMKFFKRSDFTRSALLSKASSMVEWPFIFIFGNTAIHTVVRTYLTMKLVLLLLDGLLLVNSDVETDEQEQVRSDDEGTVEGSRFGTVTGADIREDVVEVFVGIEGISTEVDEPDVDDELDDLESGNPLLPPDSDTAGGQEVVPVHEHVDGQVQGDDDPLNGGVADNLGVAQQGGGPVVVGVQEDQLLLSQEQEDGVEQLDKLGQVVEIVKRDQSLGERLWRADGREQTVVVDDREDLLHHQQQQTQRDESQREVVQLENEVQLDWRADKLLHEPLAAEDDHVVHCDDGHRVWEVGQGRDIWNKLKLVCSVAHDLAERLVENRPQVETEGVFWRRRGHLHEVWQLLKKSVHRLRKKKVNTHWKKTSKRKEVSAQYNNNRPTESKLRGPNGHLRRYRAKENSDSRSRGAKT